MPELPEVESAAAALRRAIIGRRIAAVEVRHPSYARQLSAAARRSLRGRRVERVERRGKHQLLHLDDGRVLHVHFRMTGDWLVERGPAPADRFARLILHLADGTRVSLVDPRALGVASVHRAGASLLPTLGLDATDRRLRPADLQRALARRAIPIKQALMDQSVIAGVGNIYASEALWRARIDPRRPAASLTESEIELVMKCLRTSLGADRGRIRSRVPRPPRFAVYDREDRACRRCRATIVRIVQGARSTYYCPCCQGAITRSDDGRPANPLLRAARP